jgi:hypothetical protein
MTIDELRTRNLDHRYLYRRLLATVVENTIRRQRGDADWRRDKAIQVGYRMYDERVLQLLFYAPTNYVAVASRVAGDDDRPFSLAEGDWEMLGYHDICWRDSLDTFLANHWDDIRSNDWTDSYRVLTLDEGQQRYLRRLIQARNR